MTDELDLDEINKDKPNKDDYFLENEMPQH